MEWKSVLGNVAMATLIAESENSEEKALDWLKKTGLVAFARAYPHELSGGMLARVAIARAFVHMPDLVFLDEAFGNLDESLRDKTNLLIQDIWMDHRPTIFSVTHSISEAVLFSDKCCASLMSHSHDQE
jgi:ABC-type nitrate/sulfonate/bicarbonate transport system ATPase subunit